ncbi:caspase family protein [Paractinoplanes lichenicola]|uniref:Caspase family protein n=1 Tax=Paractinoplanes lichenicola TaxID=2802976 RepID=A0ABS1VLN6_9ACTN|nr:caspase family protein [Actinoplanes lichenicola]MBL7255639.1 caspase family protein [Actinoplanes lichenicola]
MTSLDDTHALVVGIADYERFPALPAAVRADARAMRDVLTDPDHGGYPAARVTLLLDQEATRDAITSALHRLAGAARPGSTVLLYFSGHAIGNFLFPIDADPRRLPRTAISGGSLGATLEAVPATDVLVILDCCHSAGAGPDASFFKRLASGRAIMAASREDELSYVLPGHAHSLFTEHLLAGLRGGVTGGDGLIRVLDLFEFVQPRVTRDQPAQHPVFKARLEQNFPIARHAAAPAPAPSDGFPYDAYISYADRTSDADWVWEVLVPRLEREGLRLAVSGASGDPGVPHIVNAERGIRAAKRTVIVLSPTYLADNTADFENVLAQSLGVREGAYRVLPILIVPTDDLPVRLELLTTLDLADPRRAPRDFVRLIEALRAPLPRR